MQERHIEKKKTEILDSSGISDHSIVKCTIEYDKEVKINLKHRTSTNWKKFSEKLNQIDSTGYLAIEDPDLLIESLLSDVERCMRVDHCG